MSSDRTPRTWYGRSSAFILVALLTVLGGVNVLCWGLYRQAAGLIDGELDQRLLAVGHAAMPRLVEQLSGGPTIDHRAASRDLDRLRAATGLEQAFVLDRARTSVADARARVEPGAGYDPLRLDPTALDAAFAGAPTASPRYAVAGMVFKGAYLPLVGLDGAVDAVLYLEASAELLTALDDLWGVLVVTSAASGALALALAVMLALGVRAVRREADARSRAAHLGIMARLAAQAAHEIKNPLATIQFTAEYLGEMLDLPDEARELLRDVREEVARVDTLVEDFVALSPDIALARKPGDVAAIVEAVRSQQALTAGADGLAIELERPAGPVMAPIDAARIRQVVLNLALNARQATPPGGRVTLRVAEAGGQAVVEVADTGRGMSPEELARARDPFYTTRAGGTGLGLAVAEQIAAAHGGRLEIESAPGRGTTCRLLLPSPAQ